jgi:hypothetical protein
VPKTKKKAVKDKEIGRLGQALRTLGSIGGGMAGNLIGQPALGSRTGHALGASVSRWLGSGDYTVSSNSLVASGSVPMMHKDQQSVIIRHKEYLGAVTSSTTFNAQYNFVINPGNGQTFPWLSKIASSFQEYRIRGMVFHYVPSSGDAVSSTNPALGTVMFHTSYRSTDNPPTSKIEMLNEYWATENVPSQPFAHPIECDPKENPFNVQYVRSVSLPTTENQLMYDLGVTTVATQGMQTSGNPVGDIWISYEVELKKPLIYSSVTSRISYFKLIADAATTSDLFAGTQTISSYSNMGVTVPSTGKVITIPAGLTGTFTLVLSFYPSAQFSAASLPNSAVSVFNCTETTALWSQSASVQRLYSNLTGTGTQSGHVVYATGFTKTDPGLATITFPVFTWTLTSGSVTSCLVIAQVS